MDLDTQRQIWIINSNPWFCYVCENIGRMGMLMIQRRYSQSIRVVHCRNTYTGCMLPAVDNRAFQVCLEPLDLAIERGTTVWSEIIWFWSRCLYLLGKLARFLRHNEWVFTFSIMLNMRMGIGYLYDGPFTCHAFG